MSLDQQRLEKLWDAYEQQEKDLNASLDQINILEADIETKGNLITSLQGLLGERDAKLRELAGAIKDQTDKYDKLLSIAQEMEIELAKSEGDPDSKVEQFSRVEQLEKLIELRNKDEITSEEFEDMKKEILERKPQVSKDPVEIAQEEAHVPRKKDKDRVINGSNVGGSSSKAEELREAKTLLDEGLINEDDYEKMKKEILGK